MPRFSLDKDYYQILGVSRQAGDIEIKKQFFKQAKLHHPDIVHSKKQSAAEYKLSQERFKEINEAYQVLSDAETRKSYDSFMGIMTSKPVSDEDTSLYGQFIRRRDMRRGK